ncbi:MAG: ion transporter [Sphingobacteriales bacterium]|nr:MAG: ion transporter [Sphingobacteriales bacterium]
MAELPDDAFSSWRKRLHDVIYETNTRAGRVFDVSLLLFTVTSTLVVVLDSVPEYHQRFGRSFLQLEWIFTFIFTIEYILRLLVIRRPIRFILSPLGIIDLLAILPSYLSIVVPGAQSLLVLRALRLLRIFRIFKLTHYIDEAQFLTQAIRRSLRKIAIFMLTVVTITIILGSVMYLVEGEQAGFTSIPTSIYWAVVTITTVGYGDIAPLTALGKFIASVMMLIGYGIIAVPTGILTSEISNIVRTKGQSTEVCPSCGREGHDSDARYCKWCGSKL